MSRFISLIFVGEAAQIETGLINSLVSWQYLALLAVLSGSVCVLLFCALYVLFTLLSETLQ